MQRLDSTFDRGWPGMGLLSLRVTAAITSFHFRGRALALNRSLSTAVVEGAAAGLLGAGLWTPISGRMMAGIAVWTVFSRTDDPRARCGDGRESGHDFVALCARVRDGALQDGSNRHETVLAHAPHPVGVPVARMPPHL
jgi:hypothetical protein